MKIYIALFTTLIAAGHFTNVSAADATASVDGASHPHLRALADAAVDGPCRRDGHCDEGEVCSRDKVCVEVEVCLSGCNNNDDCPSGRVCTVSGGSGCSGTCKREACSQGRYGGCNNDDDCGGDDPFCTVDDERGCNGVCCPRSCGCNGICCPGAYMCDSNGIGCPSGFLCHRSKPWAPGCHACYPMEAGLGVGGDEEVVAVQDEDEIEVSSLRASILKED